MTISQTLTCDIPGCETVENIDETSNIRWVNDEDFGEIDLCTTHAKLFDDFLTGKLKVCDCDPIWPGNNFIGGDSTIQPAAGYFKTDAIPEIQTQNQRLDEAAESIVSEPGDPGDELCPVCNIPRRDCGWSL